MTSLEHLLERGLIEINKPNITYDSWMDEMKGNINWRDKSVNLSISDLWLICQYVRYVYQDN